MPYVRRNYKPRARGRGYKRKPYTARRNAKMPVKYRKAISTIVDRRIHRNIENKYAAFEQRPTQIPAYIGSIQGANLTRIIPSIPLGVNANARTGRKITPKYLEIKGWVTLDMNDTNQDYDRVVVRMMLVTPKQYPLYPDALQQITSAPGVNWTNQMMDYGTSVDGYIGTLSALQARPNVSVVKVHAQRFMTLTRPRFYDAPLVGSDAFRYSGNSTKFFKIKVRLPKVFHYRTITGNDLYPMNFDPVLCTGYSLLNGATPGIPDPTAPTPVTLSYTARFSYEDA